MKNELTAAYAAFVARPIANESDTAFINSNYADHLDVMENGSFDAEACRCFIEYMERRTAKAPSVYVRYDLLCRESIHYAVRAAFMAALFGNVGRGTTSDFNVAVREGIVFG